MYVWVGVRVRPDPHISQCADYPAKTPTGPGGTPGARQDPHSLLSGHATPYAYGSAAGFSVFPVPVAIHRLPLVSRPFHVTSNVPFG
ncbi:hypothetical protein ABIA31_004748 [Catenulispora sp. MAP5-51]